jgi:hypothetical protein
MVESKDMQEPIDRLRMMRYFCLANRFRGPAWPNLGPEGVRRLMLHLYQWEVSGEWIKTFLPSEGGGSFLCQ